MLDGHSPRRGAVIVLGALLMLPMFARAAHADLTSDLYSDAKSVIEDLMTDEVAETVVPRVVCRAGRTATTPTNPPQPLLVTEWHDEETSKTYELLALKFYGTTFQRLYSREFSAIRGVVENQTVDLSGYLVLRALQLGTVDKHAVAAWLLGLLPSTNDQLQQTSCEKRVTDLLKQGAFATQSVSALDAACAGSSGASCNVALAVRALLQNREDVAENYLFRAFAPVFAELIGQGLAKLPAEVQAKFEGKQSQIADAVAQTLQEILRDKRDVKSAVADLAATLAAIAGVDPSAVSPAALDQALAELSSLRTQWMLAGTKTQVEVATAVAGAFGTAGALMMICGKGRHPDLAVCRELKTIASTLDSDTIKTLISSASRGDVRSVAHTAVLLLFRPETGSNCSDDTGQAKDATCQTDLYRRFAASIVAYTIDEAESESPSDATRAAVRAAVADVVREIGTGGGFGRRRWYDFVIPEMNLRVSWNPAYVNQSGRTARFVASIDVIKYRGVIRYSQQLYTAIHLSLLDPLAPLAELSLRKSLDTAYTDQERLGWDFITPRIEFVLGIPQLSQHLAVGGGISARLVVPFQTSSQIVEGQTVDTYSYETLWQSWSFFRHNWPQFVEFGFFIKYVI
jgi:hypothetical protein